MQTQLAIEHQELAAIYYSVQIEYAKTGFINLALTTQNIAARHSEYARQLLGIE